MKLNTLAMLSLAVLATAGAVAAGSIDSTLALIEERIDDDPRDPMLRSDYANLLVIAGRYDEAADSYRAALEIAPDSVLAHYNLGLLLLEEGRPREAAGHFRRALAVDPSFARAEYGLGAALARRNRHRRAVGHFSKAFALDQGLLEAHNNPEILFNELATWASMHDYLSRSTGRGTRVFHDAEPIVGLLLPATEAGEMPAEAATDDPDPR